MKCLVVEDEFISRTLLTELLSTYGTCHVATNGLEAVEAFQNVLEGAPYDLICLDIMMPHLNGQEALQRIRALEAERGIGGWDTVKVIFPTATDTSPPGDLMERIKVHLRSAFNLPDDKVATMLPTFLVTLQGHMGKIEELFATADLVELGKAAHTMKGALLNLGLQDMAAIAHTIELRGKAQDSGADFAALVRELRLGIDTIK